MHMLEQLHLGHEDIRAILDMLEQEIDALGQEGTADLSAMKDAFYYMTQYLGPVQNTKERVIYSRIVAREQRASRLVDELIQQHEELRRRSEELLESVEDMTEDVLVAKEEFDVRAHHYIELQRQHVEREANELLPLADQLLTAEDWQRIEQKLRQRQWPSFIGIHPGDLYTLGADLRKQAS